MYILIADDIKDHRLDLKLKLHKTYPDAIIYEASSIYEVVTNVFDVTYDLLILELTIPGNDLLESFVGQAVKYTKIVIQSASETDKQRVNELIRLGADAFLSKSAKEDEVASILDFLFNDKYN